MSESETQAEGLAGTAQELIDSGRVLEVRILQAGTVVTGIVADADATRHRVYIRRRKAPTGKQGAEAEGECSCGARGACVHIAAVSLAAARQGTALSGPRPRTPSPATTLRRTQRQRLYYVLEATVLAGKHVSWQISVWVAHEPAGDPSGPPTAACPFAPRPSSSGYPRYVDAEDVEILHGLASLRSDPPWPLHGEGGAQLLSQMLGTGRLRAWSVHGPLIRQGAPRSVSFEWRLASDGRQYLTCDAGAITLLLDTDPILYLDQELSTAGPLQLPWPPPLLRSYWRRSVPPEAVAAVKQAIRDEAGNSRFPRPKQFPVRQQALRSLTGKLHLTVGPDAILYFLYNGIALEADWLPVQSASVRVANAEEVLEVDRDLDREFALRGQLRPWVRSTPGERDWLHLLVAGVPALREAGWEVQIDPRFPYRIVEPEEWYADARTDRQPDWFDLNLGVVVAGQRVNLLPALTRYLQTPLSHNGAGTQDLPDATVDGSCCRIGEHWLLRLEDGRHLAVPVERIRRIAATLVELFDRTGTKEREALRLPLAQGSRLAQLASEIEDLVLQADDPSLEALAERLRQPIVPRAAPAAFPTVLRSYQEVGLGWLQRLSEYRRGGLLADDMGLGKTVQALAHIALEKEAGRLGRPALIVAPVSALANWQSEIHRFLPHMTLVVWHGARRQESLGQLDHTDLILTGYALLQLDAEILQAREYSLLILDEAQAIKNPATKISLAARSLRAEHRLCLTGTPVENHLGELWSLFDLLQPGFLGTERQFQRHYRVPIEKHGDQRRAQALSERVAPFLLRRTKESVAAELPPKTEIIETLVLDERQRDFYDGIRLMMHRKIQEIIQEQGVGRSQITILDALMRLRQACCDPRLLDVPAAQEIPSVKLEWLANVLPQLVAEGRRILLFSQFTSMLHLIEAKVAELGIAYSLLTGSTTHRAAAIERFQSGGVPLFLISLRAGGTALNLTAADTVIHYDPWWNPAVEAQASDRAHRIGQDKPVFVYKLIAAGTVEERMMDLKARKQSLASGLYAAHEAASGALTAMDVEALLAP